MDFSDDILKRAAIYLRDEKEKDDIAKLIPAYKESGSEYVDNFSVTGPEYKQLNILAEILKERLTKEGFRLFGKPLSRMSVKTLICDVLFEMICFVEKEKGLNIPMVMRMFYTKSKDRKPYFRLVDQREKKSREK